MKAPKRLFAGQLRYSRRGFDRLVAAAKQRRVVAVDELSGKPVVLRRKSVPTDAQAVAGVLASIEAHVIEPEAETQ